MEMCFKQSFVELRLNQVIFIDQWCRCPPYYTEYLCLLIGSTFLPHIVEEELFVLLCVLVQYLIDFTELSPLQEKT
jgi:hypothetical protein